MAKKSVVKTYTGLRNEQLLKNSGKYSLYNQNLEAPIGSVYDVYGNEDKRPQKRDANGILGYTYNLDGEYGKKLNETYGRDIEQMGYYSVPNVKPSFTPNDHDGFKDYREYFNDTYGMRESYAGYLAGLLGVRDLAENVAYDIFPNLEGKTFADTINEILQYTDIKYAMEHDKVGIVRDIDVAMASKGVITTNINNYSGKDTRLGMLTNQLYSRALLYAAQFNSLRMTKYITPELEKVYGNNLSNVYNLSSLFRINEETGRLPELVYDNFINNMPEGGVIEYLTSVNSEFKLPEGGYNWNKRPIYGPESMYYGFHRENSNEFILPGGVYTPMVKDGSRDINLIESDMKKESTSYYFYNETDTKNGNSFSNRTTHQKINFNPQPIEISGSSILGVTNSLFKNHNVDTLIGRFHTNKDKKSSLTQSAVHSDFGLSKGRNLLTKTAWENPSGGGENVNGYDNPYCRVWTYHHQYSKMTDLIRPFVSDGSFTGIGELQKNWKIFRNFKGDERLDKHSVLNKNGMINITPTGDLEVDIKQCMFSIENLAWKDVNISGKGGYTFDNGDYVKDYQHTLSEEQRGPNGGRIMWFPPYDIEFQETTSAEWNESVFIGRGEPVYTYNNTKRTGSLSFTMLIDHPSILNYWLLDKKKDENKVAGEQALLRYFAGCEQLEPSEDVIEKILNGTYLGGKNDVTDVLPDRDIVFYTFFPNNYSGVDDGYNVGLKKLFGGQGVSSATVSIEGDNKPYFLGYEMGTNPINTMFTVKEGNAVEYSGLMSVMSKKEAAELYPIEWFEESEVTIPKEEFESSGSTYVLYNSMVTGVDLDNNLIELNNNNIERINTEIEELRIEKDNVEGEIADLEEELSSLESGTTQYTKIQMEINEKRECVKGLEGEIGNKHSLIISINKGNEDLSSAATANTQTITAVENKFTGSTGYLKTIPLYLYRKNEYSGIEVVDDCKTAYCSAVLYNIELNHEEFRGNDDSKRLIIELPEQHVIKTFNSGDTLYWKCEAKESSDVIYNKFENKRKFKKSPSKFGYMEDKNGKKTYLIKDSSDNIIEYPDKGSFNEGLFKQTVLPSYETLSDFEKSKSIEAFLGNGKYAYYEVNQIDTFDNAVAFVKSLYSDIDDDVFIETYYSDHVYTQMSDFAEKGADYCMVQYYYELERKGYEGEFTYTSIQDFIIKSKVSNADKVDGEIVKREVCGVIPGVGDVANHELTGCIQYANDKTLKEYQYPHDNNKKGEQFAQAYNYVDLTSFGLNSTYEVVKKEMGDNNITCSFGEFFAGVHDGVNGGEHTDFVLACEKAVLYNMGITGETLEEKMTEASERIKYVALRMNAQDKIKESKIKNANIVGDASSDGTKTKNTILAKNRANFMKDFLKSLTVFGADENGYRPEIITPNEEPSDEVKSPDDTIDISDVVSKKGRNAKVSIVVGEDDYKPNENITKIGRSDDSNKPRTELREDVIDFNNEQGKYRRYDNERLFFQMLKENDDIAYNNLIDKVKFFSPAYHSITPEGFNARLTFLQQCTRQGPTVTSSDLGKKDTAANLAFGRAPFCVLRLGDFLNTKIVVKSVNITYPDSMWDLNPDGIGAQFMMAKVQMNIDIIGGSDLSAPIKRLQNAVSFNYYANTSIYDNRSDISVYDDNDGIRDVRSWSPELKAKQ